MKVIKIIFFAIIGVVGAFVAFLSYYGLFATVTITEKEVGPYTLVYKKHIGDIQKVPELINEVAQYVEQETKVSTPQRFGLFYDNPQKIPVEKLRNLGGVISKNSHFFENDKKVGEAVFPKTTAVVIEYPYKGLPSALMGIFKVYPKLDLYLKEKGYSRTPIMELYDSEKQVMYYITAVNLKKDYFDSLLEY